MKSPAVVLLDLHLPKVSSNEVLRQARAHPVWRLVPIVVLTTSRDSADIARAYGLGANPYIVKPVSYDAFAEVVRTLKANWLLINEPPYAGPGRRPL